MSRFLLLLCATFGISASALNGNLFFRLFKSNLCNLGSCTVDKDCLFGQKCEITKSTRFCSGRAAQRECTGKEITYQPGKATVTQNGMILSAGLSSRLLAEVGKPVALSQGGFSKDLFPSLPDAAAIFEDPNSDNYKYVINSEAGTPAGFNASAPGAKGLGGVGSMTFDKAGNVIGFEILQNGTIRNCGGGKTWWNTWMTCEEWAGGQIYEIHPFQPVGSPMSVRKTVLAQPYPAPWESAAYDNRDVNNPTFYSTIDRNTGPLLRYTPSKTVVQNALITGDYTQMLHSNVTGTRWEYLVLVPDLPVTNATGSFYWTANQTIAEQSANLYYRASEGLDIRNGILYFTAKRSKSLYILNLDRGFYTMSSTISGAFDGEPDQVGRLLEDIETDLLYFCEDTDDYSGVHGRDASGRYYSILQGQKGALDGETSGIAFGPGNQIMYVSFQTVGKIFAITRDDGRPFNGTSLDIKYHSDTTNSNPFELAPP